MKDIGDALLAVIPAYFLSSHTMDLSLFNLIKSFNGKTAAPNNEKDNSRQRLFDHFVGALKLLPSK